MTDTATPSPTRLESELAHRLALGWALWRNKPPRECFGRRAQVVLDEAHRLLPGYLRLGPDALAMHVSSYSLPAEYVSGPHSDWCGTWDGKPCTCEVAP